MFVVNRSCKFQSQYIGGKYGDITGDIINSELAIYRASGGYILINNILLTHVEPFWTQLLWRLVLNIHCRLLPVFPRN